MHGSDKRNECVGETPRVERSDDYAKWFKIIDMIDWHSRHRLGYQAGSGTTPSREGKVARI